MSIWQTALSLFGASQASKASSNAADAQVQAVNKGIDETKRQFNVTQSNLQPFLKRGNEAGSQLNDLLFGRTTFDPNSVPGYTASLNEGLKATERSAFARGQGLSGRTLASLQDLGQKYNYNAFNTRLNQLAGVSGSGQTAGTNLGFVGGNASRSVSDLLTQGGNARASGIVGSNNAWQSGIENTVKGFSSLATLGLGSQ